MCRRKILYVLMLSVTLVNGGFDPFSSVFPKFPDFSSIFGKFDKAFKTMEVSQDKNKLSRGIGGVTLVETKDKVLIMKDGNSYVCQGRIIKRQPFCVGILSKFQTDTMHDYCYSEQLHHSGDMLCIGHSSHTGLSFSESNGHYSCSGSNPKPTLLVTMQQFYRLCGRLPWEKVFYYFPNPEDSFHVRLPNPDLGCPGREVCVFKPTPKI